MFPRTATLVASLAASVSGQTTAGHLPLTGSLLDTGCYDTKANGNWGYCGPPSCRNKYATCPAEGGGPATVNGVTGSYGTSGGGNPVQFSASNCQSFLPRTTNVDITNWNPPGACTACTQVTAGVCSAAFLERVVAGDGVKYAYCNDKWLVLQSSGEPGIMTPNLNDVPFPPGDGSKTMRTGMATLDTSRKDVLYFPLTVTELPTSDGSNNVATFGNANTVLTTRGASPVQYGLPNDGGTGVGVNGQSIFPIYNNQARYTPAKCEVDSCQTHVGQGGGQPHWHGDPFGDGDPSLPGSDTCMYNPSNYTGGSSTAHPPVIGFSFDGYLIYGRYLSNSAPGFAAPLLDNCGGHKHTTTTDVDEHGFSLGNYHYHTQVFDATCGSGDVCTTGETYKASTTGPFQCWKADLSAQEGSSALLGIRATGKLTKNQMAHRCCGMTDYYALTGIDIGMNEVAASSKCSAPAPPANGIYASGSACATQGATLLSGWRCHATCNSGYVAQGQTTCVKGTITEQATCVGSTTAPPTTVRPTTVTTTTLLATLAGSTVTTMTTVTSTVTTVTTTTTLAGATVTTTTLSANLAGTTLASTTLPATTLAATTSSGTGSTGTGSTGATSATASDAKYCVVSTSLFMATMGAIVL